MHNKEIENRTLTDIVELENLQKIQDAFSKAFDMPALIYNVDGKSITEPSGFTSLCSIIRSSDIGNKNCELFDKQLIEKLKGNDKPYYRKGCAISNMLTIATPIYIRGQHFANFAIGQVVEGKIDEEEVKKYANQIGIEPQKLLDASKSILPQEKTSLKKAIEFVKVLIDQIIDIGIKNIENQKLLQEKIKQEKEIAEKNEMLNLAFDNDKVAWWDWNYDTGHVNYSPNKATMLGYTPEEFPNQVYEITALLHPDDYENTMQDMRDYFTGKKPAYQTIYRIKTNGTDEYKYYYDYGKVIERKEDGSPKRLFGIVFNLNEQKEIENQLIAEKEKAIKNEQTINKINKEIAFNSERLERQLNVSQYHSKNTQELLDFALEQAIKLTQSQIGYIYYYDEIARKFTLNSWSKEVMQECKVMEPQTVYELDKTGLWGEAVRQRKPIIDNDFKQLSSLKKGTPNGHVALHKFLTIPIFSEGKIVAVVGVANKFDDYNNTDIQQLTLLMDTVWKISEQIKTELSIRKLQQAVESSKAIVVITDTDGNIEYANQYFTKSTGYTPEEYLGHNPRILKTEYHDNSYYKNLWNTISNGNVWEGEFKNKTKDGKAYWEQAIISPIKNDNGKIINYVAVKTNITEFKALTADLTKAKEKAEESDQLKSAFLRNISHEVRTPMNAILGFSDFLFKPNISETKKEQYSKIVNTSIHQLLNIVENIITIAHIETKQIKLSKTEFKLADLIQEIKLKYTDRTSENVVFDIFNNLKSDISLKTDYTKLKQILEILLDNACKFTTQGNVKLSVSRKDSNIVFKISDTGIGIPSDKQEIIFKRFTQADDEITRNFGGLGIGLSIAIGFVKSLNGSFKIISSTPKGTEIQVSLPLLNSVSGSQTNITAQNIQIKTILVAEDEEQNFLYINEILTNSEYKVLHAINGKEAVRIFSENKIDLILMDLKMPILDGFEATKEILKINNSVPIIAQTAYSFKREECIEAGFVDYITKPFKYEEFINMIDKQTNK